MKMENKDSLREEFIKIYPDLECFTEAQTANMVFDNLAAAFTIEVDEVMRKLEEKRKEVEDGWEDPRRYGEHKALTHALTFLDQLKTKLK
jgi:hypothetical protein